MYDKKIKNYSNFFKVLSNDVRIKILFELAFSNKNYTYLMDKLNLKQSTLSNHISKLREYGIIYTLKKNGILEARLNRKVLSEYLCEEIFNPHKLSVENYELDNV